jgi:hypothetical protein
MRDLKNQKFNHWTVLYKNGKYKNKDILWLCRCDCGHKRLLRTFHLTKGYSKQCRKCADKSTGLKLRSHFDDSQINSQFWIRNVVYGAKKRGIKIKIKISDADRLFKKQKSKCALTGLPLKFPRFRKDNEGTASLDRKDSSKPYEIGNIQWVHKDVNIMKNNYDENRFIEICHLVVKTKNLT